MEFTDLQWGHELYVAGHLIQAAVAWKRGLGDDRLLRIAERFVGRIDDELGPGRRELVCGHPEIEMALVELYRTTNQERYLALARTLVERRGHGLLGAGLHGSRYWQDHEPVRTAPEPGGHAVRQMYLDCGVVDVAMETGDSELLNVGAAAIDALRSSRMYLTGARGSAIATRPSVTPSSFRRTEPTARRAPPSAASCWPGACCSRPARHGTPTSSSARPSMPFCRALPSTAPTSSTRIR